MMKLFRMLALPLFVLFLVSACSNGQEVEEDMAPEEAPASIDMNADDPAGETEIEDPANSESGETEIEDPANSESGETEVEEDSTNNEELLEDPEIEDSNK